MTSNNDMIPKRVFYVWSIVMAVGIVLAGVLAMRTTTPDEPTSTAPSNASNVLARRCADVAELPTMGADSVIALTDEHGERTITFTSDAQGVVTCHDESAWYNIAIGPGALWSLTTGSTNLAIGESALDTLTTGSRNFATGKRAGSGIVTGSGNVLIGDQIGSLPADLSNTMIVFGRDGGAAFTFKR